MKALQVVNTVLHMTMYMVHIDYKYQLLWCWRNKLPSNQSKNNKMCCFK